MPGQTISYQTDYKLIADLIKRGEKVLDLGCGDGELLKKLIDEKKIHGTGVDIEEGKIVSSISKGLSVIQGDLDEGLKEYQTQSYDWIVLHQTLQMILEPELLLDEMLRVAKKCIVAFPNFGYLKIRTYLFFKGEMPKTKYLPYEWYNTPNIRMLTIKDFVNYCRLKNIKIIDKFYISGKYVFKKSFGLSNLIAHKAIYVITK